MCALDRQKSEKENGNELQQSLREMDSLPASAGPARNGAVAISAADAAITSLRATGVSDTTEKTEGHEKICLDGCLQALILSSSGQ